MKRKRYFGTAILALLLLPLSATDARSADADVYWRIDPSVESCSMVVDPSLTQAQWRTFTREAGAILTFKSLAPATTLGRNNVYLAIDDAFTPVDQRDPAWINTFVHPDEDCPLGDEIEIPSIRARIGVSDNVDVGGFWTSAQDANYGAVGGEIKYKFLEESGNLPAAAVRTSVSILTGVADFNLNIYSVDLLASKRIAFVTPYVGVKESLIVGTETTEKVDLAQERRLLTQMYAGVSVNMWRFSLAAEYNFSTVNTLALAVGFIL